MKGTPREKKHSPADLTIISRVQEIATKRGWKMSAVALAWVGTKVSSPIVGCNSVSHSEYYSDACIMLTLLRRPIVSKRQSSVVKNSQKKRSSISRSRAYI